MGRGRAKAKQTKVARELKYHSGGMDLDRLRDELVGKPESGVADDELHATEDDEYAAEDDEDDILPSPRAASR